MKKTFYLITLLIHFFLSGFALKATKKNQIKSSNGIQQVTKQSERKNKRNNLLSDKKKGKNQNQVLANSIKPEKTKQKNKWTIALNIMNLPLGIISFLFWSIVGTLWSITIIGLPTGAHCFRVALFLLWPFGKKVVHQKSSNVSGLFNILWLVFGGLGLACCHLIIGIFFCLTIFGIPWGLQQFQLANLALYPFHTKVV